MEGKQQKAEATASTSWLLQTVLQQALGCIYPFCSDSFSGYGPRSATAGITSFAATQMDLEGVILNEVNQRNIV